MTRRRARAPVVLKFGGSALDAPEGVARAIRAASEGNRPVLVVVSARTGVTDALETILRTPRDLKAHQRSMAAIVRRHPDLSIAGRASLHRLARLVRAVERGGPPSPPERDRLRAMGERLSVHWMAEQLRSRGIPALPLEADHLGLITDNAYGAATIRLDRSARAVRTTVERCWRSGRVPIVTGYFGRSLEGRVAVLGRGGSDYSATALGYLLHAARVDLMKPGVSIRSGDPREIPGTRPVPRLSYGEAEDLAQFGSRVLHPLSIGPARRAQLEVRVLGATGHGATTRIGPRGGVGRTRVVNLLPRLRLIRIRVAGGRHRPGALAEVLGPLARAGIPVVAVFTSATRLSLVVGPSSVRATHRTVRSASADHPPRRPPGRVALLAAIGDGVLGDLPRLPPSVLAAAREFGATGRSLSFVVPEEDGGRLARALHRALVPGDPGRAGRRRLK